MSVHDSLPLKDAFRHSHLLSPHNCTKHYPPPAPDPRVVCYRSARWPDISSTLEFVYLSTELRPHYLQLNIW
jgi:hypothetical protein